MTTPEIKGEWVNAVLRAAITMCPKNENAQLSILTRALVLAAKTCGVDEKIVLSAVAHTWATEQVQPQPKRGEPN